MPSSAEASSCEPALDNSAPTAKQEQGRDKADGNASRICEYIEQFELARRGQPLQQIETRTERDEGGSDRQVVARFAVESAKPDCQYEIRAEMNKLVIVENADRRCRQQRAEANKRQEQPAQADPKFWESQRQHASTSRL